MSIFLIPTIAKWNYKTHKYEPYEVPEDWIVVLTTQDLDLEINCTSCGVKTTFGVCYTSKTIHNYFGFGYPVCEKCYNQEWKEERESKKVS